jgi:cation:H+ antiporter
VILPLVLFGVGIGFLVGGAWLLIGGGSRIAALLGVPTVVVGLTVVAFGTSAPELFVSAVGAWRGNTGLVLGNVIGSNVANLGLILATAALLRPVRVEPGLVKQEVPLLLLISVAFTALAWDGTLGRADAGALVVGLAVFMVLTLKGIGPGASVAGRGVVLPELPPGRRMRGLLMGLGMVLLGVAGLAGGGHLIVGSALDLARRLGISETVIGLTLVAVGTSLPELATTITAAVRREDDLAVGNIVGSNLFNILGVAGPVGLCRPLADTSGHIHSQLVTMVAVTMLVGAMVKLGRGSLGRGRGAALLLVYGVVMALWTVQG